VESYLSLRDFVDEFLLHSASRCFLVAQGQHAVGVITSAEVREVPRESWAQTSVQSVMRPLSQLRSVPPDMPALKALELMNRENVTELAVVSNGKLQGIFSQMQAWRFLQLHSGLQTNSSKMAA
jgi:CBS domain-containing protein